MKKISKKAYMKSKFLFAQGAGTERMGKLPVAQDGNEGEITESVY